MTYENNYYLIHYGIPKMRWGVRRYQNADGTLTELGKKHYSKDYTKRESAARISRNLRTAEKDLEKFSNMSSNATMKNNRMQRRLSGKAESSEEGSKVREKLEKSNERASELSKRVDVLESYKGRILWKAGELAKSRKMIAKFEDAGITMDQIRSAQSDFAENQKLKKFMADYA